MTPNLDELIEQLVNSGKMSPELLGQIDAAMHDPAKLDEVLGALNAMGADQIGSGSPLNIEDFYRDGPGTYEAQWPIAASLPIQFSQLDRKTKFFVLFQEWTRREMEGMMALNGGNLEDARATFNECLERARQIDVAELMARSYEDLGKVADRLGDRTAGREYAQKAAQARAA